MKVGTDAVLLGAWCNLDKCDDILDVGTGTGIIALMCAQRSLAKIAGIEIDPSAASQARENFAGSIWWDRLTLIEGDIRTKNFGKKEFDFIVCNPPYFKESVLSRNSERNIARHSSSLELDELAGSIMPLLSSKGRFAFILPIDRFHEAEWILFSKNMYLARKTDVSAHPDTKVLRVLSEWTFENEETQFSHLSISEKDSKLYHPDFLELTDEFYL